MASATGDHVPLEPVEQKLIDCVERGDLLDLAGKQPGDTPAMHSVRAGIVREVLRGRLVPRPDPHGVRLRGARIVGRLDLANIISTVRLELYDCLLEEGLAVADAKLAGISLAGCRIEHTHLPAISAERLTTPRLDLDRATITCSARCGAVALNGAHLGELTCENARLQNNSGPALLATWLRVDRDAFLGGFEAIGAGELGTINLNSAHLGGLSCAGAKLHNDSGPALHADGLRVDQSVFLGMGFEAVGAGDGGAVRLLGAHLDELECDSATLHNESGPALNAAGLRVDQNVFLCHGFEAVGTSKLGAVRLHGAHLGTLRCTGAKLRNDSGTALVANRVEVDQKLFFDDVEAFGAGTHAVVDLADTRVAGTLVFKPAQLEHQRNPQARIDVNGLVYSGLPQGIPTSEWLRLLRQGTRDYTAQPYQHLAAAHRAAGHDTQARRILMTQRRDQIDRRALTGHAERAWARLTGLTLGYGYQPWRALIGLLLVIASAVLLAVIVGGHGGLAQARTPPGPQPCTAVERVGVGLDLGTPLLTTGIRARCDTTNTAAGQGLAVTGWALRLLAWAFATLFIAGFTSAVRRT